MMKRALLILSIVIGTWLPLTVAPVASAVNVFGPCSGAAASSAVCKDVSSSNGSTVNPVISTIGTAISIVALIIGVAAVVVIVISGLRMVLSGGDPNAVKTARDGIIYALVGVAVAVFAQTFVVFVLHKIK